MTFNVLLLTAILLLLSVNLFITRDIFSPSCVVCESFLLAYICSVLCSSSQTFIFLLDQKATLLMVVGLLLFSISSNITGMKKRKRSIDNVFLMSPSRAIHCSKTLILLFTMIQVSILGIFIIFYRRSVSQILASNITSLLSSYRSINTYGEGLNTRIPSIVTQLIKLSQAIAFICLYVYINNRIVYKYNNIRMKWTKDIMLVIIAMLYLPFSILQGQRSSLMELVLFGFVVWYVLYKTYTTRESALHKLKTFRKILLFIVAVSFGMIGLAFLLGRNVNYTNPILIIAMYLGRNMQVFNRLVETGVSTSSIPSGGRTFFGIFKLLSQMGIIRDFDSRYFFLDFSYINGYSMGNTYTAFGRYYMDFGNIGCYIIPIIEGLIFGYLYKKAFQFSPRKRINFNLVIYALFSYSIFFYSLDGLLFSSYISLNYLIIIVAMVLVGSLVTGKIRVKKQR